MNAAIATSYIESASSLPRLRRCLGSVRRVRIRSTSPDAEHGTNIHDFLRDLKVIGREAALAKVPLSAPHRSACEQVKPEDIPDGGRAEITFAWDPKTGKARVLGCDLARDYAGALPGELVGTADISGEAGDFVIVVDYKTGNADAAKGNWQMISLAVMAAAAFGKSKAKIALAFVRPDGSIGWDTAELSAMDLDGYADELAELCAEILSAREEGPSRSETLDEGAWCNYCPALMVCPAKALHAIEIVGRAQTTDLESVNEEIVALTPVEAGVAWDRVKIGLKLLGKMKESLQLYAERQPIELASGKVIRPISMNNRTIEKKPVLQAIEAIHGSAGLIACSKVTLSSIEEGLQSLGVSPERIKEEMKALELSGAITTTRTTQIREASK